MSLEHKAFAFDYESFENELKSILLESIRTESYELIRDFVERNIANLSDPYEGELLDADWESYIEEQDFDQYGDFALTKYYSPKMDQGLGYEWEKLNSLATSTNKISPLLGFTLACSDRVFDPGKMGSYFQSNDQLKISLNTLMDVKSSVPQDLMKSFEDYFSFLTETKNSGKGLYITF